jgi:uncharacterized protein (DUF488 family)
MIKVYTIGFTKKTAKQFFDLLIKNKVKEIVDIRLNNSSQLAGFAKGEDLKFFAKEIGNINYSHHIEIAPSKELLSGYRKKEKTWNDYERVYQKLLDNRDIASKINVEDFNEKCLLCSEHIPEQCHRRLFAEFLQKLNPDVEIIHLK